MHGDQHDAAGVGAAEARLKKMDERHLQFAEGDGFNFHKKGFTTEALRSSEKTYVRDLVISRTPPTNATKAYLALPTRTYPSTSFVMTNNLRVLRASW